MEYIFAIPGMGKYFIDAVTNRDYPLITFDIPQNIMSESFLSFVGLGLEPPYASWGTVANEGWRAYRTYPYLIWFPGLILFIGILAFDFLGDGLRDALDPQTRKLK